MRHIHVHSEYSNAPYLDAIMKVKDIPQWSFEKGAKGVTLTDHEIVGGHLKFLDAVRALNKKGKEELEANPNSVEALRKANFQAILGNEIYITREGLCAENHEKGERYYHFLLLAKDREGWVQINELSSRAWDRKYIRAIPRRPTYISDLKEIIGSNPGHVIATTACLGSWSGEKILEFGKMPKSNPEREILKEKIINYFNTMVEIFGRENFFLELQPGQSEEQKFYNQGLVAFSGLLNIEYTVGVDAHYPTKDYKEVHAAFLNSQEAEGRETGDFYDYTYLMEEQEIFELLTTHLPVEVARKAIDNTDRIGESIESYTIETEPIIPLIPLSGVDEWESVIHKYDNYEWFNKFSHSKNERDRFLIYKFIKGFEEKLKLGWVKEENIARANIELGEIYGSSEKLKQPMSAYFTTFQGMIDEIWTLSVVAPGRGSAGTFFINYVLDITQIDPLKQPVEFPPWRFISADKASLADVDIDISSSLRSKVLEHLARWFGSFGSKMINIGTYGTEKSKSALITAARGLGLEPEDGLYFSSLVPMERGFLWSLHECYYGDLDKGRKPIPEFVEAMKENPKVWKVAQEIEGLISRSGVHAAGVAIFNDGKGYNQCAIMRAPSGVSCTQYSLDDLERLGVVKYDILSTDAIDAIQSELYMLAEDGYIDWERNLRTTYWKYLHPEVIEYKSPEMWKSIHDKQVLGLFQFYGSPQGEQAIELIKPTDLLEMASINAVMRLMSADGAEMPLIQYKHRKEDINIWYNEMHQAGLSDDEIKILEEHMLDTRGMCITQEQLMIMLMDKRISGFSFLDSDKARKVISKKKMAEIEALKDKFFTHCEKQGTSSRMAHYVWNNAFSIQLGYSFSIIHTISYSIIAIQEMNLVHRFPPIYWAAARLMTDSGSTELLEEDLDILEYETSDDEEESHKISVNYFKMSSAIGNLRAFGIDIEPPDINESRYTFSVDVEENKIYFGLAGLSRIGANIISEIIEKRPFLDLKDFLERVKVNKIQATMLIKAGAFDRFGERSEMLAQYISTQVEKKKNLTLQNANQLIELGLTPPELLQSKQVFRLTKHLKKFFKYDTVLLLDGQFLDYAEQVKYPFVEFDEKGNAYAVLAEWEKWYKNEMIPMKNWIAANKEQLIESVYDAEFKELYDKYSKGTRAQHEMEALSFYHGQHELEEGEYPDWLATLGISNFFDLPEEPEIEREGANFKMFKLTTIAGTCIGRDKQKKIVGFLTPEGFLRLKIYRSQFVKYDKQIKQDGVIEPSWFSKGSKLLVQGYRSGEYFIPKAYKNSTIQPLTKIEAPGALRTKRLGE
jgi:DNA polymerase-3 subunit alpha